MKSYLCCGGTGKGCQRNPSHAFGSNESIAKYQGFAPSPVKSPETPKYRALVLDCEMAGVTGNDGEIILICVADYFTGAIPLKKYVLPSTPVNDWRTQIHGIKSADVRKAVEDGEALAGWEAARQALWDIIDIDTILIGHALHHDLAALRMLHPRIIDSSILTNNAVNVGNRMWGLETLFKTFLHIEMRNNKGKIHNCEEDVFATREIVLWCMRNAKEFREWADMMRVEETRKKNERNMQRRGNGKGQVGARARGHSNVNDYDDDDEDRFVRWEDIAEDCGYPHPDTGYDPWSD